MYISCDTLFTSILALMVGLKCLKKSEADMSFIFV